MHNRHKLEGRCLCQVLTEALLISARLDQIGWTANLSDIESCNTFNEQLSTDVFPTLNILGHQKSTHNLFLNTRLHALADKPKKVSFGHHAAVRYAPASLQWPEPTSSVYPCTSCQLLKCMHPDAVLLSLQVPRLQQLVLTDLIYFPFWTSPTLL